MDSEKIREEFGHKGKPKQWQEGFDALLKHMPDYFKANKEPVAKLQFERGVIKPCPFCGDEAEINEDEHDIYVSCNLCCARGEYFNWFEPEAKENAINAWNKRAL